MRNKTKNLVLLAMFVAVALMLNYFERFIPIAVTIPGVKLGLANVVSLVGLSLFGFYQILIVVILRTLLSAMFYGSISALMFSMAGGIFSLVAMWFLYRFKGKWISTIGISIVGAVFHNIGQVTVAVLILKNLGIYGYLPILLVSSIITGVLIGVVADRTTSVLKSHRKGILSK